MIIRPQTEADTPAVTRLVTDAFTASERGLSHEPLIVQKLMDEPSARLWVAEDTGTIVGQIAFSPVTIDGKESDWIGLGPVAVRPADQGEGTGAALIRHGLEDMQKAGAAGCVLLGNPAYYSRFGFTQASPLHLPDVPQEYFQALAFGTKTPGGSVRFHPAFDAP